MTPAIRALVVVVVVVETTALALPFNFHPLLLRAAREVEALLLVASAPRIERDRCVYCVCVRVCACLRRED
jgi:hypothetical protein